MSWPMTLGLGMGLVHNLDFLRLIFNPNALVNFEKWIIISFASCCLCAMKAVWSANVSSRTSTLRILIDWHWPGLPPVYSVFIQSSSFKLRDAFIPKSKAYTNLKKWPGHPCFRSMRFSVHIEEGFCEVEKYHGDRHFFHFISPVFVAISGIQKVWPIMLPRDNLINEVPVFGSWVHPIVLVDFLEFEVGIGNDQLVFCTDG